MMKPKLILSPNDFSDASNQAASIAADFAAQFGAELCLVHIVPAIPKLPPGVSIFKEGEYEQRLHAEAAQRIEQMARQLEEKGVRTRTLVGTANDVGMELVRIAEHEKADMIVIATHGMTGWHRLAFGSVAEKVVRAASCPVLVIRAAAASQAATT
jgi:nucleotide-binding universal stress UspA family protein